LVADGQQAAPSLDLTKASFQEPEQERARLQKEILDEQQTLTDFTNAITWRGILSAKQKDLEAAHKTGASTPTQLKKLQDEVDTANQNAFFGWVRMRM
jgi:hypothetical protein